MIKNQNNKDHSKTKWEWMNRKTEKELAKAIKHGDQDKIKHWERENLDVHDELLWIEAGTF